MLILALVLGSAAMSSCKKDNTKEITIDHDMFMPASLTVDVGTTVRWENQDNDAHTVTSDAAVFDSDTMQTGQTFSYQFNTVGSFPYHCELHSGMQGTVTVE